MKRDFGDGHPARNMEKAIGDIPIRPIHWRLDIHGSGRAQLLAAGD
jgi:hypothetical protein